MHKKFLIVGGGVAGVCLAHQLIKQNHQITLVDAGNNICSVVAAGIVHPMSFRRTLLSWRANPFYFESKAFYMELESVLNARFFHPIMVRRLFATTEEEVCWKERLEDPEFKPFMHQIAAEDIAFKPHGSGRVDGFWIDAPVFISESHRFFSEHQRLINDTITADNFNPETLEFNGDRYDAVVFATGYKNKQTPWFSDVPINSTKGQLLTVKWNNPIQNTSLHRKAFALPIGNNEFRVGSTYEWHNDVPEATPEGRALILANAKSITADSLDVIAHSAGIRPTTPDRRPMVGKHTSYERVFMFNGLGAKGYMLAPPLAAALSSAIINDIDVTPDLHPYRFNTK
ncbi:MAG: NAD(P)/FAD-dependent oxidoreductase [Flavobacteriales bacterium]